MITPEYLYAVESCSKKDMTGIERSRENFIEKIIGGHIKRNRQRENRQIFCIKKEVGETHILLYKKEDVGITEMEITSSDWLRGKKVLKVSDMTVEKIENWSMKIFHPVKIAETNKVSQLKLT